MPLPHRTLKSNLASLGFFACLLPISIVLPASVAFPSLAQVAPAPAQPKLSLEGTLDEKSESFEDGRRLNFHTFEGTVGEKLTLQVTSQEFAPLLFIFGVDPKTLLKDDYSGESAGWQRVVTLPATGTYTLIVTSAQPKETGRYQLQVRQTTPEDVALAEAERLNQQAMQLYQQGKFDEAIPLAEQALAIRQQILGKNHPDVATSLGSLAALYHNQGRYAEAESLYQRSLQIRETQFGKDHPDVAKSLNNLAGLYQDQGRYLEAESLYQRSLQIYETQLGKDHPDVAQSINNLAALYQAQGRYAEAEALYQRSSQIRETQLGKDHPDVAQSINNLAALYQAQGRYAEAEPLYQRSSQIWETQLGKNHPLVANSLNNLATLYYFQGRYREAEPLYQRSLQIRETQLGKDHPDVAQSLNNLASLYQDQGRYLEAELFYQRSLQSWETQLGNDHPLVATSLNNLAGFYHAQGRYAEAEALYQRSLQIRETQLGKDHPNVATSLNNLAGLYREQGRYAEAEALYQSSLQIFETQLGKVHPNVATSLNNLAALYQDQENIAPAIDFLNRGMDIQEHNLDINLAVGAESQKQAYLATLSSSTNQAISLHLQSAPNHPQAAHLALTTLLRRKGRILDAQTTSLQRLRQNLTPADQPLFDNLTTARTQLATLYYGGLGNRSPEQYRAQIDSLQQQASQLEAALNNRSAEFRTETQPITLAAVQAQIPAETALVELIRYQPFNPNAKPGEQWGKPRYAAYILSPQGSIQAIDLGETATIDPLVAQFRHLLQRPNLDPKPIARQLDAALMQPIRAKLGNTRNLLLSPDSQLNLIPFAALVDEQNRYLVETTAITYLASGRDLLRFQTHTASRQPPLILANPDYDRPGDPTLLASLKPRTPSPHPPTSPSPPVSRRSTDLTPLKVTPLPGTALEAAALAAKLPTAIVLTGRQATENALQQAQSPRILHIATHGFFLQDLPQPTPRHSRAIGSDRASAGPVFSAPSDLGDRPYNPNDNPLLRAGLALAGFNPRQSGNQDGVLTALEAANLNLRGTQLVVLSACETGVGDIANGEGVYGLRRAFSLAGAETQLISLWKVSDEGTQDLMVKYYDRLLQGEGRSEALLQIQREFLKDPQYRHPFYWASFIPSGNWRSFQ